MIKDSVKIIGGLGNRMERDFYPTPPDVTQALINYLKIPQGKLIWECACGDGDMVEVFQQNGYKCIGTDIKDGYDFLTHSVDCDWIITNPPFNLSEQFIKRAVELKKPFAFLLKSQYWHSKRRLKLFEIAPPIRSFAVDMETRFHGARQQFDGYGMGGMEETSNDL